MTDDTSAAADPTPESVALPAPPPMPVPRRSQAGFAVLGGAVAAVLGFALAQVVPDGWPLGNLAATEVQVAAQAQEIAALKTALAGLSAPVAADPALADRVTALENRETPELSEIDARVAGLEAQIAVLASADGSPVAAAALAALQAEVAALKASGGPLPAAVAAASKVFDDKLAAAEAQTVAIVAKVQAAAKTADQRSALGQIRAALDSGAAFASVLPVLEGVALPEVLTAGAAAGLPTLQSLQAGFPDAARSALDAAMRADMGESWTQRVGAFLLTQTGARSLSPREGSDPDAILSRGEAALRAGDLTTAISELNSLPAEGLAALQPWLALANTRLVALDAVATLSATLQQ